MILYCLCCAGSSIAPFQNWKKKLNDKIEICPIEYPGHGSLMGEELINNMQELVSYVIDFIDKHSKGSEFQILGHSLGAFVTYEVAKYYEKNGNNKIKMIYLCGSAAPNFVMTEYKRFNTDDDQVFLSELYNLGGIPDEFMNNMQLQEIYLPILRNDFEILHNYVPHLNSLKTRVILLNGQQDLVVGSNYIYWKMFLKECNSFVLEGDHFFLHNSDEVFDLIEQYV